MKEGEPVCWTEYPMVHGQTWGADRYVHDRRERLKSLTTAKMLNNELGYLRQEI
ncbi:hypothetical protein [Stutzerimonas kirkiae]|uniref:hypothetical protein n=1 Tax=Stutzerimonas kirkiae TaxID=2211392 RepID=UPI0013F17DD7|nr:hypothetical protein [Stutzerimonas kirkiae]